MEVVELWRYPVKSLGGERLTVAEVGELGLSGDRRWGIRDDETGNVLTARREPRLLFASARLVDGSPVITTSDGDDVSDSARLSAWLGRPVTLTEAGDAGGVYENPMDPYTDSDWVSWQGPAGAWHDSGRSRVSLVSLASLGAWDIRRFRTNVVVSGADEMGLVTKRIRVGAVELDVTKPIDRCVMVTRPQPGLSRDLDVLKAVNRELDGVLSVGCLVASGGSVGVGDLVTIQEEAA